MGKDYDSIINSGKSVKTDFYGGKHNVLVNDSGNWKDPHIHIGYNPRTGETFGHFENCETKGNHPGKK